MQHDNRDPSYLGPLLGTSNQPCDGPSATFDELPLPRKLAEWGVCVAINLIRKMLPLIQKEANFLLRILRKLIYLLRRPSRRTLHVNSDLNSVPTPFLDAKTYRKLLISRSSKPRALSEDLNDGVGTVESTDSLIFLIDLRFVDVNETAAYLESVIRSFSNRLIFAFLSAGDIENDRQQYLIIQSRLHQQCHRSVETYFFPTSDAIKIDWATTHLVVEDRLATVLTATFPSFLPKPPKSIGRLSELRLSQSLDSHGIPKNPAFQSKRKLERIVYIFDFNWLESPGSTRETLINQLKYFQRLGAQIFLLPEIHHPGYARRREAELKSFLRQFVDFVDCHFLETSGSFVPPRDFVLRTRLRDFRNNSLLRDKVMSPSVPKIVREKIKQFAPDLIFGCHYRTLHTINKLDIGSTMKVCELCDIQSFQFSIYGDKEFSQSDFLDEVELLDQFDGLISVSELETQKLLPFLRHAKIVTALQPRPLDRQARKRNKLFDAIFVSSSHLPNVQSFLWFVEKVYRVHLKGRAFRFGVAGNACEILKHRLTKSEQEEIILLGKVDSLGELYQSADKVLLPVIAGSGVSIKTVEAIESKLPFVATSWAFRGLNKIDCFRYFDSPAEFAAEILRSMPDAELASHREKCDKWSSTFNTLDNYFSGIDSLLAQLSESDIVTDRSKYVGSASVLTGELPS